MPPVLHVALDELARARSAAGARATAAARRGSGPSRPAAGRGSRTRRPTGSSRCVPSIRHASVWYSSQPFASTFDGRIGRLDLHRAERSLPVFPDSLECDAGGRGAAEARSRARVRPRCRARPRAGTRSGVPARARVRSSPASPRTGSSAAPTLPERRVRDSAAGRRSDPLRPMNSVRSPVTLRLASSTSKNATRSGNSMLKALRANSAPVFGIDLGRDVHGGLRPQVAEHPLDVPGHAQSARLRRIVAQLQHRELHRCVERDEHRQFRADAGRDVLEHAVAEAVPADVAARARRRAAATATRRARCPRRARRSPRRSHR